MTVISFDGIEDIGKQFYSGIITSKLKSKMGMENVQKIQFPSYTTATGNHLSRLIKQFKTNDLAATLNPHSHNRYRKIATLMVNNFNEYQQFISLRKYTVLTNNYFSIFAYGLAADVYHSYLKEITDKAFLKNEETLAFFLVAKDVSLFLENNENEDYVNYFKMVNQFYKSTFLNHKFNNNHNNVVLIEIDYNNPDHVSNTLDIIKSEVKSHFSISLD